MNHKDLYERVTTQVIAQIEAGAGTWAMPWRAIADNGQPTNATTHKAYRGGNHMWMAMVAQANGWSRHWGTYRQWSSIGAQVRRGERSTYGVHWSAIVRRADDGQEIGNRRLVPNAFSVFNACQVDGWEAPAPTPRDTPERIADAERFFANIGADVRHGGNRAAYSPSLDAIVLPDLAQFNDAAAYYATSAHEHGHWTGHPSRLARDLSGRFGTDSYAAEELVAELSAAFTCAHVGISTVPRPDHASYITSWLHVLRADASALFTVASKAQAASDLLAQRAAATATVGVAA